LELSIFIQSNIAFDTTTVALSRYADVELLLFQHKTTEALVAIDSMLVDLPGHDLTDDLLYVKADIKKQQGEFGEAAELLNKIVEEYGKGLLGARSYYELGMLYENNIKDKDRALELYNDFLKKYPGSIYTTEVRKRFRILRGDAHFVEESPAINY
jgi:tetratricopeptide (TPR) repeat protein